MVKNNKTCILCGKVYSFCNRCEEFDHLPRWMAIYCSDNCRKIFSALTEYNAGNITKEQAAVELSKCDLSDKEHFHPFNQEKIDEIFDVKDEKVNDEKSNEKNSDVTIRENITAEKPKRMKSNKN